VGAPDGVLQLPQVCVGVCGCMGLSRWVGRGRLDKSWAAGFAKAHQHAGAAAGAAAVLHPCQRCGKAREVGCRSPKCSGVRAVRGAPTSRPSPSVVTDRIGACLAE
jgi:hypothetical protein